MTIDDRRLDELLAEAANTYRVPPPPELDAIWERVEAEAFTAPPQRLRPRRWAMPAAIAASLAIGVIGGRASSAIGAAPAAPLAATGAAPKAAPADPYKHTTEEFFGRAAVLLTSFHAPGADGPADARLIEQASRLLTTTRLLIDSPVGKDRRTRELLQDLELVLAQVARLQHTGRQGDIALIAEAMEERDVLPRLRTAVTNLSISDY